MFLNIYIYNMYKHMAGICEKGIKIKSIEYWVLGDNKHVSII